MFKDSAFLHFGASFEKKMKEHLEQLKCLRQSMAPKYGYRSDQFFFKGAAPSIHLGVVAATTEEEADRDFTLTPIEEVRDTGTVPEEGTAGSAEIVYTVTIYVWKTLPVVHVFARIKRILPFCDSQSVNGLGIVPLAMEFARRSLPLAGRLQHFKSN